MRNKINQYLWVAIGCIVSSISINAFLVPHHLLSGGVSGVAIIFYFLFDWPIGVQIFLMNLPLLYAAYRLLGKEYTIGTIFGTILFSFTVDATRFFSQYNIIDDPIISAITGGVIAGIGSGLIFRVNGSAGGLDIVAALVKKYYAFNFGAVGFAVNCVIMLVAAMLFGLKLAMLTLISMFISASLTDKVVEGFNRKKTIFIVSYNTDSIVEAILKEVGRGVTILNGQGAFTRQSKQVLFVVVSLTQIAKIKQLVHDSDPQAFMIVHDAAEVMGRGFTLPNSRQI
ncbi:YitT family protein [Sporomusa sp.]|uniref:YitT family protein n=1 Tax=Sporomusa sp. TaxID=2078658 RepID=UPI002C3C99F6|nr:YitT family protein [Sporomusa sp.]HWR42150.1 YitT family protein [Sporomusa sp.]